MNTTSSDVLVSICCTAYNLEKYISQTIESFLSQKTTFKYEIIVGEDCSKDSTRQILLKYSEKYPDLIQVIMSEANVGIARNYKRVLERAKGKYIAICDGDDYWVDPLKLQKQVDFLENNCEYVICCHYSNLVDSEGKITYANPSPKVLIYSYSDILTGKRTETRNSSLVIHNNEEFKTLTTKDWLLDVYAQDRFLKLFATAVTNRKIYVMPELMGCYRVHQGGIWSMAGTKIIGFKTRSDFNLIINNFKYSSVEKRKLFNIYMKRYFFYDIKNLSINRIFSTFQTLV